MATVFWDAKGVILAEYLESQKTITDAYYAELLHLRKAARNADCWSSTTSLQCLSSRLAKTAVRKCEFEELPHPPYSPDLAPSDFPPASYTKKTPA